MWPELKTQGVAARDSANGQMDLFSGTVKSKSDIIDEVKQLMQYGTEEDKQAAINRDTEQRRNQAAGSQSEDQAGTAGPSAEGKRSLDINHETGGQPAGPRLSSEGNEYVEEGESPERWTPSEKRARNGEQFYQSEDGNIDLVDIPQEVFDEIGYTKAPFRLTPSMLKHVQLQHGKETKITNEQEAIKFITDIMKHFDHVRLGNDGALIFSIENGRKRTGRRAVTISLDSDSGFFYGIKTSGFEGVKRLERRPLLWERSADVSPSTDAATEPVTSLDAQRSGEQSGSASGQRGLSESKDRTNSANLQENGGENAGKPTLFQQYEREQGTVDKQGGLVKDEKTDSLLSEDWRGSLHVLGRRIGRRIKLVSNAEMKRMYGADGIRGCNDKDSNTIYLNEDYVTGEKGDKFVRAFVTGHELTHGIKELSEDHPELWDAYLSAVKEAMGDEFQKECDKIKERYERHFKKMREAGMTITDLENEEVMEEVAANWAGNHLLTDTNAIRSIVEHAEQAGADPVAVVRKVLDWIKERIAWLTGLKARGEDVNEELAVMQRAREAWQGMYDVAAAKQSARTEAEQQPTENGGGVKFSLSEEVFDEESKVLDDASEEELSTSKAKFSIVEDPEEIERLEKGPKVTRYRAMVEIDGKLYPPMSVKVDGKLREPTEPGVWERSDETPFEFTEEQKAAMAALDAKKGKGSVEIVPGKVRYIKDSETGTGTLKFRLKKDNGDDIWAAYNPYFHTSTSGMNDQFSSAWKRPNLVVVEVEVPESELSDGYQAPYAKDAVGDTPWKSGTVNNALPADRQRTVTLSRWAKVKGKVDDSEVARMIAQQLEGLDIEVPFNVVTPSLREELVKLGVRIGPPEKGNAGKSAIPAYEEWVKSQGKKSGQVKFAFAKNKEDFDKILEEAKEKDGIVMPGLATKNVEIIDIKKHPFEGSFSEAVAKAKEWAKKNFIKKNGDEPFRLEDGTPFEIPIGSVKEFLHGSNVELSDNGGIHLAVMMRLPEILQKSIEAEIHPDYLHDKDGHRTVNSEVNKNILVHWYYGAVRLKGEDVVRRVATQVHEVRDKENRLRTYKVNKIKLDDAPTTPSENTRESALAMTSNNFITGANLLNGVEKSKDKGVFLLDESAKLDEQNNNGEIQNNQSGQENGDNVSESVGLNFGTNDVEDFMTLPRVKELVKSVKVPERITSQAQAAMWTYQVLGRVRGALNKWYGDVGSKDFRMGILSTDSDQGREIDLRNALYGSARVNEYLDFVQPKLYEARDNSTSEEARRYFEELIDDCNYARQWYDRAAKGDTTVLDDAPPRFDIDPDAVDEESENIFTKAKERFGTTDDLREAGYILPDGTMLDFSGRHQVDEGQDTSYLRGGRTVDHRDIKQLNYEADGNTETGMNVSMEDFIGRGAIRIDGKYGAINLQRKPTKEQERTLRRLIQANNGYVTVEIGNGYDSEHYGEYDEGTKATKVLGDISRYFDEGIRFDIDPDAEGAEDYDAGRMTLDEMISKGLTELAQKNSDNVSHRVEAMRSIGGNLQKLRQAMALQREYDRGTVDSIVRLARLMMGSGLYTGFSPYEVSRLMGMVNRAAGREDITKEAEKVVDMMVDHQRAQEWCDREQDRVNEKQAAPLGRRCFRTKSILSNAANESHFPTVSVGHLACRMPQTKRIELAFQDRIRLA